MAADPLPTRQAPEVSPTPGAEDDKLAAALGAVIDRALARHPAGETFVYGIHQGVGAGVVDRLRDRYVAAGWTRVSIRPGATGALLLVLGP